MKVGFIRILRTPARGRGFPKQVGTWALGEGISECGRKWHDRRGRIKAEGICVIGRLWSQFLRLYMLAEQSAETQVLGKYCRSVS